METSCTFNPQWASPPGDTISDILKANKITLSDFSKEINLSINTVKGLMVGKEHITPNIASKLECAVGGSKAFWLNREAQFRDDLERLEKKSNEISEWIEKLPVSDMAKMGWIKKAKGVEENAKICLEFFNVSDIDSWYKKYDNQLAQTAFRTSDSFDSQPESVLAWLRQGEILADAIDCKPFSASRFKQSLLNIRELIREKDPRVFMPKLQQEFAEAGVAIVFVRAPSRCRASGATYFANTNKAILTLSFRYRTDDHFWFSLFHEAGHILLHGKGGFFLEFDNHSSSKEEMDANEFAAESLIPGEYMEELHSLSARHWRQIVRFAKKVGVSPGVVVGQLQFLGIVNHDQLNKLKVRYDWKHI